ncbi:hypothetical protein [Novosphingobium aureum]|uniref:hypothetical protein n=1 Tax=Novosphingobium aureum TaxID=2792964 RepID=UPI002B45C88C|nr:hypothetical protein [Novosphingobium aureum]
MPEPMVFDLVRGLGARAGELEVNTLATTPLSGQDKVVEWAPEIEYAIIDNLAIEFELPFENMALTELKVGVQGTFGTFDRGRIVHGVQYLGIYHREDKAASHALLYLLGRQHSDRWSTMTMLGVGDVRVGQSESEAGLLVNHTTFYKVNETQTAGLEVNYKSDRDGGVLVMPQYHASVIGNFGVQVGLGVDKQRGEVARPVGGLRAILEF